MSKNRPRWVKNIIRSDDAVRIILEMNVESKKERGRPKEM